MGYGLFIGLERDTLAEQKCLAACKSIKFRGYILRCTRLLEPLLSKKRSKKEPIRRPLLLLELNRWYTL